MPTSDVKQDPTQTRLSWAPEGFRAQLGFTVSYPADEDAVLDQMAAAGYFVNAPHPLNPVMLCNGVNVEIISINMARVTVTYLQTDAPFPDKSEPLREPPRLRWRGGYESVPVDRDPNGKPIVNSAGDPFENIYDDFRTRFFTIVVNLPFYDINYDVNYANRCNSNPWNPLNIGSLSRGQAKCLSVMPTDDIVSGAKYVPTAFEFEIRQGQRAVTSMGGFNGVWDGFQRVLLDQGPNGWYNTSGGRGPFVNDKGDEVGSVLLDSTGLPLLSTTKILVKQGNGAGATPLATPSANKTTADKFQVFFPSAWFLTFQKTLFADFNDFGF